jgi:hypothetical protein
MSFAPWVTYFRRNRERQERIEARIDWDSPCTMSATARSAMVHSFQRFELGESGEGRTLLAKAARAGDPEYLEALGKLVVEEQRHSALFARGLRHMNAQSLDRHWSDGAFTRLRHALGLRTEIGLFLVAESVALDYFRALWRHGPDEVLRGIGERIATDEIEHVQFQIDRLRSGFAASSRLTRLVARSALSVVAVGAVTVLVVDHRAALRTVGFAPHHYWWRGLRNFASASAAVFAGRTEASPVRGPRRPPVSIVRASA